MSWAEQVRALDAREPGLGLYEVARRLGCNVGTVWAARHPERQRKRTAQWRAEHIEASRAAQRRYYARRRERSG